MVLYLIGTTSTADSHSKDFTYIPIVSELFRRYDMEKFLHDATEEVQGMRQAVNQKTARVHDKLVTKANRLRISFDTGDLLNIFIRKIDDPIRPAVNQRYNDQAAALRENRVMPTDLQLNEVFRNLATYADTLS